MVFFRFNLLNVEVVGNGIEIPESMNLDSLAFTNGCLCGFSLDEFVQISFDSVEGVSTVRYAE